MDDKVNVLKAICKALMEELEDYSKKIEKSDGMSAGDLEAIDKLTHALKSVKTTIAMVEADGGYSERYPYWGGSYADNEQGNANARGRMNARRDSMGRYSGNYSYADGMAELLDEMRSMLPNLTDEKRRKAEQLMDQLR
jgi:hypothetical protein